MLAGSLARCSCGLRWLSDSTDEVSQEARDLCAVLLLVTGQEAVCPASDGVGDFPFGTSVVLIREPVTRLFGQENVPLSSTSLSLSLSLSVSLSLLPLSLTLSLSVSLSECHTSSQRSTQRGMHGYVCVYREGWKLTSALR